MTRQSVLRGILAFFIILLMMPLGHAFVVLMRHNLDGSALNVTAFVAGALAIAGAIMADRLRNRAMAVAAGALCGVVLWGTWVEFMFITYAESVGVPPLVVDGQVYTKPEFLIMPTSIPFAVLTMLMFIYGGPSHWSAVNGVRRLLAIRPSDTTMGHDSVWALVELVLLVWYTYVLLLVCFDPTLLGPRHPLTLGVATVSLVTAIVLFARSLRAPSWASALRQAIVTVCFFWTFVEVMIKLRFFVEIWIYPGRYVAPMIAIAAAFIAVTVWFGITSSKYRK